MRQIVLLVSIVFCTFVGSLAAARLVGTRTQATFAAMRETPDGTACLLNCLMGVRPSFTTFDQAVNVVEAHPLFKRNTWTRTDLPGSASADMTQDLLLWRLASSDATQIMLSRVPGETFVYSLQISSEIAMRNGAIHESVFDMTLGDVLSIYGTPDHVLRAYYAAIYRAGFLNLYYEDLGLNILIQDSGGLRLNAQSVIVSIFMYAPQPLANTDSMTLWHGFTLYR